MLLTALLGIAAVAAVAAGRVRGGLAPPESSLPSCDLPAGPLSPRDLDRLRFPLVLRGYRMQEVDRALSRLQQELVERDEELQALRRQLAAGTDDKARPDAGKG